jgi:integrase
MAQVTRAHFEDYKRWLARRPGKHGTLSATTISCRLGLLRTFFERIIEWGYDDTPARVPIFAGDFPDRDEPLPKFLDDPTAAKFMAALATDPNPRRRLMVEILARTGIRSGVLSGLDDDAMVLIGDIHWLRIPVGKLHNDRYVPLLPSRPWGWLRSSRRGPVNRPGFVGGSRPCKRGWSHGYTGSVGEADHASVHRG